MDNLHKGQGSQGQNITTTTKRVNMSEMGTIIVTTTSTRTTMVDGMIGLGLMYLLKIGNLLLGKVEAIWCVLKI